jgi:ABC-2 type transport system permease protein
MEKYLLVLKNSIQNDLTYRFNTLIIFFSDTMLFAAFFYLWSSIYKQGGQIGNYTLEGIVLYYFAATFVALVAKGDDIGWEVGDEIRLGKMTSVLLWPISYSKYNFFKFLGGYVYRGAIYSLLFLIIGVVLSRYLNFAIGLSNVLFLILSMSLGFVIYFLFFYAIALSTFWFGLVRGFNFAASMIAFFLEGSIIPLDLLPSAVIQINNFLPFKYMMFVPVSIFTGKISPDWFTFLIPLTWIAVLYLLDKLLFIQGVKKYEGYGA